MKLTEIRVLKDDDLRLQVERLRREIFDLRFKGAVENIPQPHRLKIMRRDIARSLTVLEQRRSAAEAKS